MNNVDMLSEEVNYLNMKSSRIESVLESDGSNYQEWKYDIDIYAETVKYGREILKGDKVTVRTRDKDNDEKLFRLEMHITAPNLFTIFLVFRNCKRMESR